MDTFKKFPSLNFLKTFESVARHLSFTNAAKELFLIQAAVSHQIKALGKYLGVKLFHREKRKVLLSDEGQKLLPSVVNGLKGIADILENIHNYETEDTIVVGVGSYFSANWLVQRLGTVYQKYPEVNLHLKIFNNDPDFGANGTDLAVVWGKGDWQGLICEKLMVVEFTTICSPDLSKKTHPLKTPEDLIHCPLLDDPDDNIWQEWLEEAVIPERKYKLRTIIRDSIVLIHSTLEGHGFEFCSVGIVQEYLDSGRLIHLFDLSITGGGFYYLVYPGKALRKPLVRLFKTWLLKEVWKDESGDHFQETLQ